MEEILHYTNRIYKSLTQRRGHTLWPGQASSPSAPSSDHLSRRPESKQESSTLQPRQEPPKYHSNPRREGEQKTSDIKCYKCLGRGHMARALPCVKFSLPPLASMTPRTRPLRSPKTMKWWSKKSSKSCRKHMASAS